jgi:gliding-associated putative ABC transporter substrate-binding component GldG
MKISSKLTDYAGILIIAVVLLLVNVIATEYFVRFDFTSDKRFTITEASRKLLSQVKDPILVEVYLEGDFPAGFDRLKRAIKEKLDDFAAYSDGRVQYKFTDPSLAVDAKKRNDFYLQLAQKGLQPTNLHANEDGKTIEKIIFPSALVRLADRELPVQFLKGNQSASAEQRLNQSIEGVEFELATVIQKISTTNRKRIGVIQGHRELNGTELYDIGSTLKEYYGVEKVDLQKVVDLNGFDAIIVARPDSTFSEPDKFKIDQFVVKGGNALFFLDAIKVQLDSIKPDGSLHLPTDTKLTDLLFRFGVRINADIVMDMNSAYIPLVTGYLGDKPQTQMAPWRYFPIVNFFGNHPIVKNMDALQVRFASSMDTVMAAGIQKTPLFFTSNYSRIIPAPVRLSFNDARLQPKPEQYKVKNIPLAYLLEGTFQSLYTNRLAPETMTTFAFKAKDKAGKVLVVSDGDFVRNDINYTQKSTYPLGFDRFAQVQFANKDFVLNTLAYMLDNDGLILAKTKEIQIRPLDKVRVGKEKTRWQAINMVAPVALIGLFGLVWSARRKAKFGKKRI